MYIIYFFNITCNIKIEPLDFETQKVKIEELEGVIEKIKKGSTDVAETFRMS